MFASVHMLKKTILQFLQVCNDFKVTDVRTSETVSETSGLFLSLFLTLSFSIFLFPLSTLYFTLSPISLCLFTIYSPLSFLSLFLSPNTPSLFILLSLSLSSLFLCLSLSPSFSTYLSLTLSLCLSNPNSLLVGYFRNLRRVMTVPKPARENHVPAYILCLNGET